MDGDRRWRIGEDVLGPGGGVNSFVLNTLGHTKSHLHIVVSFLVEW